MAYLRLSKGNFIRYLINTYFWTIFISYFLEKIPKASTFDS